jgi:hypothetical protein
VTGNLVAGPLYDDIPAVCKVFANRLRIIVDPNGNAITSASDHSTHFTGNSSYARNLQSGASNDDSIWSGAEIKTGARADSLIIGVVLVVQNHARAQTTDPVAALFGDLSDLIVFGAVRTGWGHGAIELLGIKVGECVTFRANHVVETTVQLNGLGPWGFPRQGDLRLQRGQGSINAVHVL